jgi:hypothetical protein
MIDDDTEDRSLFWDVVESTIALLAVVGIVATLCFMFGYFWYAP